MPDEPVDVVRLREEYRRATHPIFDEQPRDLATAILLTRLAERQDALEAKLDALETLVREIKHALSAGAVGKWGNG